MHRKTILLLLLTLLCSFAKGQDLADSSNVFYINTRDICPAYNVDSRVLASDDAISAILDSLSHVQPNAYPIMGQWCRQQRMRINRMFSSLSNDYHRDGDNIWIDSTHCIIDGGASLARMELLISRFASDADNYDRLEQERIEAERKAAEERARAEALRIQREKDQRLAIQSDSIKAMHKHITSVCDAKGVTDKARIKELKDIFYAYLAVYNRYDLTDNSTTDAHFQQLDELQAFQESLIDSVISTDSYSYRIEAFKNTLHLRSGKDHSDVNKSYLRVFKKVQVPITFKTIAEYNSYIGQLREIMAVQQNYLAAIDLRDTIFKNINTLQLQCSKKHKEIFTSYRNIQAEVNMVPAFTTLAESDKFLNSLNDHITLQNEFSNVIRRIEVIENRGDSIIALCNKAIVDVADAYKALVNSTDFVPKFINKASADYYNATLDEFETVQQLYITSIGIRNTIETGSMQINACRNAPKGLVPGYRQMMRYTDFTPHFSNETGGNDFIKMLNHFIEIQKKFLAIVANSNTIDANTKQFKISFKEYSNIHKAYERLLKTYDVDLVILSEADVNTYLNHQNAIIEMQQQFSELANSLDKESYDARLKKVKEPDKIKLIMGVK